MIRTCLIPAMNCPIEGPITHRLRLSLALNIGCVCVVWKLGKSGQATKRALYFFASPPKNIDMTFAIYHALAN